MAVTGIQDQVFEQKIKHEGYFKFSELYKFVLAYLKDAGFSPIKEEEYEEKLSGETKEIKAKWAAEKKITDYFKNHIEIKFKARITDVEVERGGKKEFLNKGTIELTISASLESDWHGSWDSSPTKKFWRGIYDKYIIKSTKDQYEDKLAGKTAGLVEEVKSFLVLEGKR